MSTHNEDNLHESEEIEYEEEIVEEDGLQNKQKKLRLELKEAKAQSQEYLVGWQKERADFANFKAQEEKRRVERVANMKTTLISDFFPVLDSFDMAFGNKEAWEAVDQNWRMGIEYIYTQFMSVLEQYGIRTINQSNVPFNPELHEPVEMVKVEDPAQEGMIISIVQKGYQTNEQILRPAKVRVGTLS